MPTRTAAPAAFAGNPPSYGALRLAHALYVDYASGEREYYDLATGPYEVHNVYASLTSVSKQALHREVLCCHQRPSCAQVKAPSA